MAIIKPIIVFTIAFLKTSIDRSEHSAHNAISHRQPPKLFIILIMMPTSSQSKRFHFKYRHKKKMWEPICFILLSGSRIALAVDKNNSPTPNWHIEIL